MIELGLSRITRLLRDTPIPWRVMHVAGTNGKGSVCAYASAMLNAGKIKCGRFTSPHLIDRWDCITIDEKTVNEGLFHEVEAVVKAKDQIEDIKASEFELLTATAFEIFNREKVEVGIVEVGLGGRYDATNVLQEPAVTVITKIGKDHQSLLGNELEDIAYQKAGIMKKGITCMVDGTNYPRVIGTLRSYGKDIGAGPLVLIPQDTERPSQVWSIVPKDPFEPYQQANVCLAFEAVTFLLAQSHPSLDPRSFLPAIQTTVWPGRLQLLSIESLTGRKQAVLVDGAHNVQSAEALGSYVDRNLREATFPVTWVVAASEGKDVPGLLSRLVRPGDKLVAVEFGPVQGMPWVSPQAVTAIAAAARSLGTLDRTEEGPRDLAKALQSATQYANGGPLVVAGSLYVVSDILRLLRQVEQVLD